MVTFKNVVAVGLFLFGTTFLWMTASFVGRTPPPTGPTWSTENVLALIAVVGFTAAAWGVFKDQSWWEPVAVASAVVGLVAVVPYLVGLTQIDGDLGDPGIEINLAMHVVGSAVVLLLVLVPDIHRWFTVQLR
jgi:hypothetical protein